MDLHDGVVDIEQRVRVRDGRTRWLTKQSGDPSQRHQEPGGDRV